MCNVQLSQHKRLLYRSAPSHSLAAVSQLGGAPAHGEPLFEQQWKTNKAVAARASSPGNTPDRHSHSSSPTHSHASRQQQETRDKMAQANKRVHVCTNDLWVGRKKGCKTHKQKTGTWVHNKTQGIMVQLCSSREMYQNQRFPSGKMRGGAFVHKWHSVE